MRQPSPRARKVALRIFVLLVVVGFGYALVDAWNVTHGRLPSVWRVAVSCALGAAGIVAGSVGWAAVLGDQRGEVRAGFIVAQLGKYVPGGVWQATGQLTMSKGAGVPIRRGAVGFTVMAIVQVVVGACGTVILAMAWASPPLVLRVLIGVGALGSLALLDRRWMVFVLSKIPRTRAESNELVASQRGIVLCAAMLAVSMAAAAAGYVVLLGSLRGVPRPLLVVGAFITAWTAGFLVVPIPSGLGIREFVLVGVLAGAYSRSTLVTASVYQRLVTVVAEGILAACVFPSLRRASRLRTERGEALDKPLQ